MAAIDNTKKSARLLASRRYTHDTYTDAQEAFTSTLDINANEVYIDQSLIPSASLPFSASAQNGNTYTVDGLSVVKYYYRAKMTKSDLNNEAWFLLSETTASSGVGAQLIDNNQLTNFISPKYSVSALTNANTEDATPGYGVKVFVSSNSSTPSAGDQVSVNNYVFDYKTGIIQFATSALAPTAGQYVYISVYQYAGRTLSSQIGSGTGVISSRLSRLEESTSSLNTFSASVNGHIADLNIKTGSLEAKNTIISAYTASMNTFTASVNGHISDINTYTASLRTALTASGTDVTFSNNVTVQGNLTVAGTTTAINSTTVQLGDNIIELNGTGVANGGLLVKDPTAPNNVSGSLLWDSTNDYWKAGALGAESKLLREGGDNVVTSSAQILIDQTTGFTTYSGSVSSSLNSTSSSLSALSASVASVTGEFSSSVANTFVTQSARITSLESFSGSQNTKNSTLATYTASIDTKWATLQNVTASLIEKTGSYATTGSNTFFGTETISGSLLISGSTTFGGAVSVDNANLNMGNSSSLNLTSGSGIYVNSPGVISGSITGIGNVTAFSTSVDSRLTNLQITSASVNGHIADINTKTGSFEAKFTTLQTLTASVQAQISRIQESTASLNTFSASTLTRLSRIEESTSSLNTFSASVNGHITNINSWTSSTDIVQTTQTNRLNTLESFTGSYATTGSNVFIGDQTITGSLAINDASTNFSIEGNMFGQAYLTAGGAIVLNPGYGGVEMVGSNRTFKATDITAEGTLSASVITGIGNVTAFSTSVDSRLDTLEGTGTIQGVGTGNQVTFAKVTTTGDVVVGGDLVVQGNTVTLNTSQLVVEDKLISLASGSTSAATANGAGIEVLGANATFTYDSIPNAWTSNIPISSSAVTASVNIPGFGTSKRMAFRSTTGNLDFVAAPTIAGDIPQWDGTNFVMSNVIDGGTY
jgi:hypothetical protein